MWNGAEFISELHDNVHLVFQFIQQLLSLFGFFIFLSQLFDFSFNNESIYHEKIITVQIFFENN
jgi:hypothetical protein